MFDCPRAYKSNTMKTMRTYAALLGTLILLTVFGQQARASHAMGADLTYRCLGGNTYELTFSFYRDCDGISAPATISIDYSSSCFPGGTIFLNPIPGAPNQISPVCPTQLSTCDGGTFTGIEEWIYRGTITLPGPCADWTFSHTECCRNSAITTTVGGAGDDMYVYSLLNNTGGLCNNSPTFSNNPVPFACVGQRFCFNHGAFDADGDSIVYSLIQPLTSTGTVTYNPGYSNTQPVISSPAVTFNNTTGDICMNPTQQDVTVFAVLVREYRNGVLIGEVERDIQLTVLACNNFLPTLTGINGTPFFTRNLCADVPFSFYIRSIDANAANTTFISWDYGVPGATLTTFGGRRDSAIFNWTPTQADIGNRYCFTATVTDDNCPYIGTQIFSYCFTVNGVDVNAGSDVSVACGQCTSLTAVGIGGSGAYTYTWNPTRPDSVQGATLNPACVGTYVVKVNDGQCINHDTVDVVPSAGNIAASFTSVANCSGAPVQFTDNSSGGTINSWAWSFGDGGTSNIQNPTHQYAADGTYNVQLIVTTPGGCIDTTVQQVVVQTNIPNAVFSANNECSGTPVSFSDQSGGTGINSWSWNFGDPNSGASNTSTTQNPFHSFSAPGTYNVTLTVTNAAGCNDQIQQSVTVFSNPVISVPDQEICNGDQATLTAPAGYTVYAWSTGATTQSITVNPASSTVYTVTVSDVNTCLGTASSTLTVNPLPVADAGSPVAICEGTSTTLTASGAGAGGTYTWNPGGAGGANFTVTPVVTTTYTVLVTTAEQCSQSDQVTVTVNPMPQVSADNVSAVCKGSSVTLNANSGTGNFVWQPGNLAGSTVVVTPLITTTYTVTVSDNIGCSGSDQVTVTVNPIPDALFASNAPQCAGSTISFTDNSSVSTGSIVSWNWEFDNGQTSTAQNPTSTYATNGNYNVRLVVASDGGCLDTTFNAVLINAQPIADAGLDDEICPGFNGTLTGTGGVSYLWNPGGLTTASITVSPSSTTQYTLLVTDGNGCTNSDQARVIVNPIPVAFAGSDQAVCNGESTTLFATGGDSYQWFPGSSTSSSLNVTPAATTTYSVIATNTFGCKDTDDVMVRVNPLPIASFSDNAPVCQSVPVSFNDQSNVSSGTLNAWEWDLGNGSSSSNPNPQLQYASPGTYSVRLVVTTDGGCRDTASTTVIVNAEPVAGFATTDVCDGLPVQFNNSSSISDATPLAYTWNLGDNTTSNSQTLTHQYASYGSYPVSLVVRSINGCIDSIAQFANVFPLPDAQFSTQYACAQDPATFTDLSSIPAGTINSWYWSFGDGTIATSSNPDHVYSADGYYQIDLRVTSEHGCLDSTVGLIRIVPRPIAEFATQNVCQGTQTQMTDLSYPVTGSIVSYNWTFGDGQTSGDQNPIHLYRNPGWYQVSLTVLSDSGCTTTLTRPNAVQIYANPDAHFGNNANLASDIYPIVNFTNQTAALGTYTWHFGDGATSNEYSPTHEYAEIGFYDVELYVIDENGCVDTIAERIEIRPTSNVYIPNSFSPNGDLRNDFFKTYSYNVVSVRAQIFDRWGLQIYEWDGLEGGWDGKVKGSPAQADTYVYRIVTTDVNNKQEVHIGHVSLVR